MYLLQCLFRPKLNYCLFGIVSCLIWIPHYLNQTYYDCLPLSVKMRWAVVYVFFFVFNFTSSLEIWFCRYPNLKSENEQPVQLRNIFLNAYFFMPNRIQQKILKPNFTKLKPNKWFIKDKYIICSKHF